jgi:hypothetical protein
MRIQVRVVILSGLSGWLFCGEAAGADGTWVAIPGRPDVPVIVNPYGFDSSGAVIEFDFGLDRPAIVNPHAVTGPLVPPRWGPRRYYFPHSDRQPGYGRYEVIPPPNAPKPVPAQSYQRSWGTSSDPLPADNQPPAPPMVIQPFVGGGWGGPGPRR